MTATSATANNQAAFTALLDAHRGIVFKVAYSYCQHPDDRADLIQEITTQLWRAFPKYDEQRRFSTWMYRIALNVGISYIRSHSNRQHRFVAYDENVHNPAVATDSSNGDRDFLYAFINQLDPLNRALLMLYLDAHSHAEIAEILGISQTNVATKISRLKQQLRQAGEASTTTMRNNDVNRSKQRGT